MNWYVYIAKIGTGRYYTGITTNPERRIIKHNQGEGAQLAKQQGPFKLIYVSKFF
jgi:putative endonuclease